MFGIADLIGQPSPAAHVHKTLLPRSQDAHGFFCAGTDLKLEGTTKQEEAEAAALQALFELTAELAAQGPTILFIKVSHR